MAKMYNMIVRTNPDIVLTDVIMPKMDGISVMEKVKNNTQMKGSPSFIPRLRLPAASM